MQCTAPHEINPYILKIHEFPQTILVPDDQGALVHFPRLDTGQPVVVEIGSGSGNHMVTYLKRSPECLYFGFELRYKRLYRTAQKLEQAGVRGYLIQCFAQRMGEFFPAKSIDSLIINFPDPWAKAKQRKNRIVSLHNLRAFIHLLRPGGTLDFKSDHHEYFLSGREDVLKSGLRLEAYTLDLHHSPYLENNIVTEFEQMFLYKTPKRIGWLRARKEA